MKLKNIKMVEMLSALQPILSHRDKIGYIAARNFRMLSDSLTEYFAFRNDLIKKYGKEEQNENGNSEIRIKIGTPEFEAFCHELSPYNEIEHEVNLMTAKYDDVIDCLSGEEILNIDWMLED